MTKAVIATNIPAPYRIPFFVELSRLCDLHILFDARSPQNTQWKMPTELPIAHTFTSGLSFNYTRHRSDGLASDRELHLKYGMFFDLLRLRPQVVISAEFGLRSLLALLYCALTKNCLILWSEGTPHTEGWVTGIKASVRRFLVRHADRYWVNGVESTDLIEAYGGSRQRCDPGMTGVDTRWFSEQVAAYLPQRETLRQQLQIRGTAFIMVGQLISRKGVRELLQALDRLLQTTQEFTILLAGAGVERPYIEAWMEKHPSNPVRLLGQLPPEELVKIYAAADVFLLPTLDDNWSLATLEGAVAGLPQIYSKYNGAIVELSAFNVEGTVIDPFNAEQFAQALLLYIDKIPQRISAEQIRTLVDFYSPQFFADRAYQSIAACVQEQSSRAV